VHTKTNDNTSKFGSQPTMTDVTTALRILVWGSTGWIGGLFIEHIQSILGDGATVIRAKTRLEDEDAMAAEVAEVGPDRIVLCAGKRGVGNVDWCESHAEETWRVNVDGTVALAKIASAAGIHVTNFSSGCIYEYTEPGTPHEMSGVPYTEEDSPNFSGSVYSRSKAAAEARVASLPGHLVLRLRMPITADGSPGCFISKLTRYGKIVNIPNTVTILPDLLPLAVRMMVDQDTGVYNFANPGTISHGDLMKLYRDVVDPTFGFEVMSLEEHNAVSVVARRSNTELSCAKLQRRFPDIALPAPSESVRRLLQLYKPELPTRRMIRRTTSILVTGGAGFIGSNFVKMTQCWFPEVRIVVLDAMTESSRHVLWPGAPTIVQGKVQDIDLVCRLLRDNCVDIVFHFAAFTHVDTSFVSSLDFTENNVFGTHCLIEACVRSNFAGRLVHVSTDEVYGECAEDGDASKETSLLKPTNPYAASKVGAEAIVSAYVASGMLDAVILRGNNAYGPGQYPEKLIPRFILRALQGVPLQIQGEGNQQRSFLYVDDFVAAVWKIANKGSTGEVYNIKSNDELSVLQVANAVYDQLDIPEADRRLEKVSDREFNDRRYWIRDDRLRSLGWRQSTPVREGLKVAVDWYRELLGGGRLLKEWPSANKALTALDPVISHPT
jgi:dTDP-glucose 4,6-dehydratase